LGWLPRIKFSDCVVRGIFRVQVDMMSVNTVSTFESNIIKKPNKFNDSSYLQNH
jgi:hypothetical protein